jgi:hypothetical protein
MPIIRRLTGSFTVHHLISPLDPIGISIGTNTRRTAIKN